MIDIEILSAVLKELGYLDETDEDKDLTSDSDESEEKNAEKSKIDKLSES